MAESMAFNIAEGVLGKLGSAALQEIGLAWRVKKELRKLEDTLITIKAVLLDAEEQQAKSREQRVWMERLKDACYDADDVLEEFEVGALKQKMICGRITKKVRNFFSSSNPLIFHYRMGRQIKEIKETLDEIAADKAKFHCMEVDDGRRVVHIERETHSFLLNSDVIGRDQDKENIIHLLMESHGPENFGVIPIVGLGGLGKTTLIKMVYNDEKVTSHFHLRIWVCVSEDFNVKKLMRKIIRSMSGTPIDDLDVEQLQSFLQETLNDKRFLLVLDDVWNNDRIKWVELSSLLMGGAIGSKAIVTTRSQLVASTVGTIAPYHLEALPNKDCLSLFVRCAFKDGEETRHVNLMRIGEDIVKKCNGVALAVRTLGSLLYMKRDEQDWLSVRDSELWKINQNEGDILPALRLSYNELPSYLKQCFAYCLLYPKDGNIPSTDLIHRWMAQGLIQSSDQTQELEKLASSIFMIYCQGPSFTKLKIADFIYHLKCTTSCMTWHSQWLKVSTGL